jgi:hypothetical protein
LKEGSDLLNQKVVEQEIHSAQPLFVYYLKLWLKPIKKRKKNAITLERGSYSMLCDH